MLIWQPSGLASTWNQIPLTVGQWQVVPVALPGGARSSRAAGSVAVRPLPALKENVKRVMFYC